MIYPGQIRCFVKKVNVTECKIAKKMCKSFREKRDIDFGVTV